MKVVMYLGAPLLVRADDFSGRSRQGREIISYAFGPRLLAAFPEPKTFLVVKGGRKMDLRPVASKM